jgi:hypothetical protein
VPDEEASAALLPNEKEFVLLADEGVLVFLASELPNEKPDPDPD